MIFDATIKNILNGHLANLEKKFGADIVFYLGEIHPFMVRHFRDKIEEFRRETPLKDRLVVFLNTSGGSAEVVEKFVEIIRNYYKEVYFVVPDLAMSAGTIFCMSGDKIFMDYSSSLGPIDPQVWNGKQWIPALGYLEKVAEYIEKSKKNELSRAEFLMLQGQDLAFLSSCEQAQELTTTLLKKWLVEYKFKDWDEHKTNPAKKGQKVTLAEKEQRAEQIATALGDHQRWHSHRRMIGIAALKQLRLDIDDFSTDKELRDLVRNYNDLLTEYLLKNNIQIFLHSRTSF